MPTAYVESPRSAVALLDNATRTASKPLFFGPNRELFGFYHAPLSVRRAGVVVLCPAIGWDYEASYRSMGHLAERLALQGFAVLRFDYHGTGNSTGADHNPDRLKAWQASVEAAVAEAKALSGEASVSVFGLRVGALIAATVAERIPGLTSLVLWAPCAVGKAYVRELRAMRASNPDESIARGDKIRGGEEAGGFMLSATTVASLTATSLLKLAPARARYLVLGRDDLPEAANAFVEHLRASGADVRHSVPPGYRAMMLDPLEATLPDAAIDEMLAFLAPLHPVLGAEAPAPPVLPEATSTRGVRAEEGMAPVRERAVRFAGESRLFGIVTEPPPGAEKPAGRRVGLIFLNTGAIPHMGPHRLYVPFARALATEGFVSLRFDIEGYGDSPPRENDPPRDAYSPRAGVSARAAIDYLASEHAVDTIVLIGMCSGAYHSFHTALADPRVKMAVLLRPQVFSWDDGEALDRERHENYADFRYYVSRLVQPEAWLRVVRAKTNFRVTATTMAKRLRTVAIDRVRGLSARLRGRPEEPVLARRFKSILGRGGELVLVYSRQDAALDHLDVQLGDHLAELRREPGFHFVRMEGSDFTFAAIWSQDRLKEEVARVLRARL